MLAAPEEATKTKELGVLPVIVRTSTNILVTESWIGERRMEMLLGKDDLVL